jgi:polyisoprenoid-binding protein YceI
MPKTQVPTVSASQGSSSSSHRTVPALPVDAGDPRPRRRIGRTVLLAVSIALGLLALGAVAGPYVYIHFIEGAPPKKLTFATTDSTSAATPSAPTTVDGAWKVAGGSTVGYRVPETIMGQGTTAVGRTARVTGHLSIAGASARSADFTVDVASVASDAQQRDRDYRSIMDAATIRTARFSLTRPIALGTIPADLQEITVPVTGKLTLHGLTKPVTFTLKARRNGARIEVNGSIPITFSDYKIANPSIAGAISVGDRGELEFLLVFAHR